MDISQSAQEAGWLNYSAESWEERKPVTWLHDWDFWAACATQYASDDPVLELGCGNGRITRQLALAGHRVVAVDINPHFLNRAIDHLAPEARHRVEFVLQDMVYLELQPRFSLAVMTDWAFPAILRLEDQLMFFHRLKACLKPRGVFAFNAPFSTAQQIGLQLSADGTHLEWPGENRTFDAFTQIETRPSGEYSIRLRHTSLAEIRLLAWGTGFEIIEQFGGTDRRPLRGLPGDDLTLVLRKTL